MSAWEGGKRDRNKKRAKEVRERGLTGELRRIYCNCSSQEEGQSESTVCLQLLPHTTSTSRALNLKSVGDFWTLLAHVLVQDFLKQVFLVLLKSRHSAD